MKRIISAIIVIALFATALIAFSACGKKSITVAIPNDPTNEGRALLLLQSAGLIKLSDASGLEATPADITSNPKGLKFREIEAATLPRILEDVDGAVPLLRDHERIHGEGRKGNSGDRCGGCAEEGAARNSAGHGNPLCS